MLTTCVTLPSVLELRALPCDDALLRLIDRVEDPGGGHLHVVGVTEGAQSCGLFDGRGPVDVTGAPGPRAEGARHGVSASVAAMNLLEASWTTRALSRRLERRPLPAQEVGLEPTFDAVRWQFHHGGELDGTVRAGTGSA